MFAANEPYPIYLQILKNFSDRTLALDLIRELESYDEVRAARNMVMSGMLCLSAR